MADKKKKAGNEEIVGDQPEVKFAKMLREMARNSDSISFVTKLLEETIL